MVGNHPKTDQHQQQADEKEVSKVYQIFNAKSKCHCINENIKETLYFKNSFVWVSFFFWHSVKDRVFLINLIGLCTAIEATNIVEWLVISNYVLDGDNI